MNRDSKATTEFMGTFRAPITAGMTHGVSVAGEAGAQAVMLQGAEPSATAAATATAAGRLDPKISTNVKDNTQANIIFNMPGGRIIALEYRKIRLSIELSKCFRPGLSLHAVWEHKFEEKIQEGYGAVRLFVPPREDLIWAFFDDESKLDQIVEVDGKEEAIGF